ncbi:MAG: phage holin family protein [Acidobacteria bacterium]|nr:MAG: phage holin family protein [Acidobacteriota bacterium]
MNDPKRPPGDRTDRVVTPTPTGRQAVLETEERSVTQLLQNILTNIQEIVRSEVRLAKTEIGEETSKAIRAITLLGAGIFLGIYALGFLLLSAVYALSAVLPDWLGPLLVGLIVAVAGAVLFFAGRNRLKSVSPVPQKTITSVKEDAQWVKDQTK